MPSHADFFSSLYIEPEVVQGLLENCKNMLERGFEHKAEPCFLCASLLHLQSWYSNKCFSCYAGLENAVWIRNSKDLFSFSPALLSCSSFVQMGEEEVKRLI